MSPKLLVSVLGLAVATQTVGCFVGHVIGGNAVAFFQTPAKVERKIARPLRDDARLAVLWVGHATVLIQIDDRVILADPLFTSTVGQLSRRLVEPGLDPKNVPPVDAVIVSHMHYDHLSLGSLEMLEDRIRMLVVPDGGLVYVPNFAFPSTELARWKTWKKDGLAITAVPVRHSGFRYGLDDAWMESYSGYVIEYHGIRVYFGGDTAYSRAFFTETSQHFPDIDLALLPIAPGKPRDFMKNKHMDAEAALQAFVDLEAERMIPIHFGTFINGTDAPGEPVTALRAGAARRGIEGRVDVLAIGEQRVVIPRQRSGPRRN